MNVASCKVMGPTTLWRIMLKLEELAQPPHSHRDTDNAGNGLGLEHVSARGPRHFTLIKCTFIHHCAVVVKKGRGWRTILPLWCLLTVEKINNNEQMLIFQEENKTNNGHEMQRAEITSYFNNWSLSKETNHVRNCIG